MNPRHALLTLACAAVAGTLGGCAIQADSGPRDVAEEHPARGAIDADVEGGEATGEGRIYLVAPDGSVQPLRTVLRNSKDLVQRLMLGPNQQELDAGLSTELPPALVVNEISYDGGVVIVDVSDDINELTGASLRLAVAQIVFTASEIPGTESVDIRVNDEAQSWPNGADVQVSGPLTVYDYVGFAESSQPPFPVTPQNPSGTTAETTTTAGAATTVPQTVAGESTTLPPAETTTTVPTG